MTGVFSHGSALRQLASDTALADASAASSARCRRAVAPNTVLTRSRFWVDAEWRRRVVAAGPSHAPLRCPLPPTELVTDGGPALDRPFLRAADSPTHGGGTPCWNARCARLHRPRRRYALCSTCGTFGTARGSACWDGTIDACLAL